MSFKSDIISAGKEKSKIPVKISYRIIQLFSEGLYSSPHKAIEELVSNSFDAGATKVHAILSPDLSGDNASIAVIDNGTGMDESGFNQHWLIGVSDKRGAGVKGPRGRKLIGKFGIGKLATYVLADRLTHICKIKSKYYLASMDFLLIPQDEKGGVFKEKLINIPFRLLTEAEAKKILKPWTTGDKPGYQELKLFGRVAAKTWTVAIMSDLKPMTYVIKRGLLRRVLSTAMPLRDDFELFLDGDKVPSYKLKGKKIGKWVLGKHLKELPSPAPDELQATEDSLEDKSSVHRYGLVDSSLGRVTGYIELYEDIITGGKSSKMERSYGFFVYVHGRLINIDDEYFGINSNLLQHGTFSRFRMVVHVDRLDGELRSSRESIREGELLETARNILHGAFNFARTKLAEHTVQVSPEFRLLKRISSSPRSLTRKPIVDVLINALQGKYIPRYFTFPRGLKGEEEKSFVSMIQKRAESEEGLVKNAQIIELSPDQGIAVLDIESGTLKINSLHPFIACFIDEYEDNKSSEPLELQALSEVLLEAYLLDAGLDEEIVNNIMSKRDELLRHLARSIGKRNAVMIAQDLEDAATNKNLLEKELVDSFNSMGFDATRIGGRGKPDGYAEAYLAAKSGGEAQRYKVSLEAKSKEQPGKKVSSKSVNISGIARLRDDNKCDHALVVGPDFPTSKDDESALLKEIKADNEKTGKTITLIKINDLARLVRLAPIKRVNLNQLRELFTKCKSPKESKEWVDGIEKTRPKTQPYREILQTIDDEIKSGAPQVVEYAAVSAGLRRDHNINMTSREIAELCKAMSYMAPGFIHTIGRTVELNMRPDKVLEAISSTIMSMPEGERRGG